MSDLDALKLTASERRALAMEATYRSQHQDDFRYQNPDPVERARLKHRWKAIADALHPDPWGAVMTTLVALLRDALTDDADATGAEVLHGLVGAVQEWLGQDGMGAIMYDAFASDPGRMIERMTGALKREAGRGLGE